MVQALMSEAARARLGERLPAVAPDVQVLTLNSDGRITPDDVEAAPEIIWLSRDLHNQPLLRVMMDYALRSRSVRWVQTYLAGVDNPFYAELAAKGVALGRSDAQAPAIADFVMAQALSVLHPIEAQAAAQCAHAWRKVPFREISSLHVLLVGYGAIGHAIAKRLAPFEPRIAAIRRTPDLAARGVEQRPMADLHALLPTADLVVLACALNDETRGLADAKFFAAMKPGALLMNIARGGLVIEDALRAALAEGKPGFAVLDVFAQEPLSPDSWLWDHPQVRVTAHAANEGSGVTARGDVLFLENLKHYLARRDGGANSGKGK